MRKPVFLSTLVVALLLVLPSSATASGGGGCGGPVTEGEGTSVAIEEFCFEPAVLYAAPGDQISWTNADFVKHNVQGANFAWGSYEPLRSGASASYGFERSGVYPYVCALHPGMVGAVVVGDGGLDRLDVAPVARVTGGQADPISTSRAAETAAITIAAVVVVAGLAFARRRWGRRPTGS